MPLITLSDSHNLADARLAPFSRMTDAQLRDPHQMVGLARALSAQACETVGGSNAQACWNENGVRSTGGVEGTGKADAAGDGVDARSARDADDVNVGSAHDANWLASGLFIGESKNVIERACAAGITPFALLVEQCWLDASRPLIDHLLSRDERLPAFVATRAQMRALTGLECTRGALAAFLRPPLARVENLLAQARRVAVLENVTNYTNIGAIFRSAAALGIDAVLITPSCHDPYYRRAARVSMGTVFQVPWTRFERDTWPHAGIALLRAHGFATCALALADNAIPVYDAPLRAHDKLALVLGSEGDGLGADTIAACDYVVRIPMDHGVDSLNVAAASAVAFWELRAGHRD